MTPRQLRRANIIIGVSIGTSFGMSVTAAKVAAGNTMLALVLFLWAGLLLAFGIACIAVVGKSDEDAADNDGGSR